MCSFLFLAASFCFKTERISGARFVSPTCSQFNDTHMGRIFMYTNTFTQNKTHTIEVNLWQYEFTIISHMESHHQTSHILMNTYFLRCQCVWTKHIHIRGKVISCCHHLYHQYVECFDCAAGMKMIISCEFNAAWNGIFKIYTKMYVYGVNVNIHIYRLLANSCV